MHVFPAKPTDRPLIYAILMRSELFGKSDADTVDEMFEQAMAKPGPDAYQFIGCWQGHSMLGFACYGRESMTKYTWDLFWVCALPEARGKGVGRALLSVASQRAAAAGGRLMVIYTSSTTSYAPAHRLYESQGYRQVANVADYYDDHDDLLIYAKQLAILR